MEHFRFIDLFCGIGGFHQAMSKLGGECVFACDINQQCQDVYKNNFCKKYLYGQSNSKLHILLFLHLLVF